MLKIELYYGNDIYSRSMLSILEHIGYKVKRIMVNNDISTKDKILKIPQIRIYSDKNLIKRHVGNITKKDLLKIISLLE